MSADPVTRRSVVSGVVTAVAAVAGYVVAHRSAAAKPASVSTAANQYGAAPARTGRRLASVADIPAGGVLVVGDVVLARDGNGGLHGFSAVCTHQGCTVSASGDAIVCPCHGSRFDPRTGAAVVGPASRSLPAIAVVVRGPDIFTTGGPTS